MNRAQATYVRYYAYDSSTGQPKTGDVANHTLRIQKDNGSVVEPTNRPSEVNSTYAKGVYILQLTAAETDCQNLLLAGISSTSNVLIDPVVYEAYQVPIAAPGASGGLQTVGTAVTLPANPPTGYLTAASFAAGAITSTVAPNLDAAVSGVPAAIGARVTDSGYTYDQSMKLVNALASGDTAAGATSTQFVLKSPDGTKSRVAFTINTGAQTRTVTATDLS